MKTITITSPSVAPAYLTHWLQTPRKVQPDVSSSGATPCSRRARPGHRSFSWFSLAATVLLAVALFSGSTRAQTLDPVTPGLQATDANGAPIVSVDPNWFLPNGRPNPQVAAALQVLSNADTQGLEPDNYNTTTLIEAFTGLAQAGGQAATPEQQQHLNSLLTSSLASYLNDLRNGRVDPHKVHQKFNVPAKPAFDARQYIDQALQGNRVEQALTEAQPKVPMYAAVVKAMAHYRTLAADPVWSTPLPPLPSRKLEPGQTYAGMPLLMQRLAVLGDYAPPATTPADHAAATAAATPGLSSTGNAPTTYSTYSLDTTYTPALVEAVKTFQARHGLTTDGIIGPGTFAQLNITPVQRVEQMALTLERLRWTPLLSGPRMIVVNIPEFMLRAYEVKPDGQIDINLQMRVIVGKALDTGTPLFDEDMRFIEFSPYWNVPPSIARGETLPRLRRDPAYFNRQGFEFVLKDGSVSSELSQSNLDAVQHGGARIRQRPGPQNALGDIKFIFPNNTNIYLHHTPAPQLFERARRDFSHGCVRVEAPVALAQFVLQNDPRWTQARIEAAMQANKSQTIRLAEPIPVVLAYSTVVVLNGTVYFFEDIYGHDKKLANALKKRA